MKGLKGEVKLVWGSRGWVEEDGEEVRKVCWEGGKRVLW